MAEVAFSVDLPRALKAELEKQASQERVAPSVIVERALGMYIAAKKAKYAAIDEAMEEADRGAFVSSEAVDRWIASWDTDDEAPLPEPDVHVK